MLPTNAYFQLTPDTRVCRTLNGMWQVSGAHGRIEPQAALTQMLAYQKAGFTTWDLADHYGPAEDLIGAFRRQLVETSAAALADFQAFTKWVPSPGPMSREIVRAAIDVSRRRMGVEALDMLQFHWWEYGDRRYRDALHELAALQHSGAIRFLGLTNFDTAHLAEIVADGIPIISNQVQFSLIDQRPLVQMLPFCAANGVSLFTYGTLCGGLLSDRYLDQPEPGPSALNTASLRKYKQMIDRWGGWNLFQRLLTTLRQIADRHATSIANVAVRAILDQPAVAGVIVGTRLGIREHREQTAEVFGLNLDDVDREQIALVLNQSRDLYALIGDCGAEYRR